MNHKAYRLPMSVLPRQYDIALNVRLGSTAFRGHVTIRLEIATPTNAIALHARALNITNAQLTLQTHTLSTAVTLDPEREIALLVFAETLPTGSAALDLTYTGNVSTTLEGLFVSKDGSGELLCTQC